MHTLFSLPFMLPMLYTLKTMALRPGIRPARSVRHRNLPERSRMIPPPLALNSPQPGGVTRHR